MRMSRIRGKRRSFRCDATTQTWGARWLVGFDNYPATADGEQAGGDDTVVGQVEDAGGSADRNPGRLVVLFRVEWLDTLIPAGPRAFVFTGTESIPRQPRGASMVKAFGVTTLSWWRNSLHPQRPRRVV